MEWNNKYNYPKSTRSIVDGSRHYSVNEERLPSVTTILKATESEEKKASLQAWKQRVGQKQAEIITREASSRGSSMHEYLEKFLLGKLNLDLLGDNTRERMMADQIIENGLRNKLMKFGDVRQHYIILENMLELLTVLVFMKIKKP
jgi:genome maintenance exonuclease 1